MGVFLAIFRWFTAAMDIVCNYSVKYHHRMSKRLIERMGRITETTRLPQDHNAEPQVATFKKLKK